MTDEAEWADVVLRVATPSDLDELGGVYRRASLSNDGDREVLLAHPEVLEFAGDDLEAGHTIAATVGARIVGFATVVPRGPVWELDDLFVDPDAMRHGVARRLVADAAARVAGAGGAAIEVTANDHAAEFYAAVGFVSIGSAPTRFGDAPRLRLTLAI